jgi:poly(hydroxyalkanoate) depolymerase family esterase
VRSVARRVTKSAAARPSILIAGVTLLSLGAPASPAIAGSSWHTYSNAAGTRQYLLVVPARKVRSPALVVYLHGCNQTAAGVANDTGWAKLADEKGLIAVFPQEPTLPSDTLLKGCWGWSQSANQHRGAGEASIIAGITAAVAAAQHVDRRRIYVLGLSAGAYMANIMAVAYPDLYAAAGILAGGPYGVGTDSPPPDLTGGAIVTEMGARKRALPVIVIQATNDNINPYGAGFAAVQQWLNAYDLIDDGQENDSVSHLPASIDTHYTAAPPHPGSPTVCDTLAPCLGGMTGLASYPYSVAHYDDPQGGSLLDFWTIYLANHDYAGGTGTFMDPTGPSLTAASYAFLLAHHA